MGALFSSNGKAVPGPAKVSESDKAVLKLKVQRDKLQQHRTKLEAVMAKEKAAARECLRLGDKDKARALLRKKQHQEAMLRETAAKIDAVETMADRIEGSQLDKAVVEGLRAGTAALDALQQEYSIDYVTRLMNDAQDGIDQANEIHALLAGKMSAADEADVEAEFLALVAATPAAAAARPAAAAAAVAADALVLPDVPSTIIAPAAPTDTPEHDANVAESRRAATRPALLATA